MNTILNFFVNYWPFLIVVVAALVALFVLLKKGYKDQVKRAVFYLVCQAEKEFGDGTGTLKYESVVKKAYDLIPLWARFLIDIEDLDNWIEAAVDQLKKMLSEKPDAKNYFTN